MNTWEIFDFELLTIYGTISFIASLCLELEVSNKVLVFRVEIGYDGFFQQRTCYFIL